MQWFPRRQPVLRGGRRGQGAGHAPRVHGLLRRGRAVREHVRPDGGVGGPRRHARRPTTGDVLTVTPVMKVRGRYRDFAILETPTLGALTRGSRVATNVYEVLKAARGKQVLFFPARFDAHEVQAADGYSYQVAVQLFNQNFGKSVPGLGLDRCAGRLVGRRGRRHGGPRGHRLFPGRHGRGHHGVRRHDARRHPAHRAGRLPQRLRRHLAAGDPRACSRAYLELLKAGQAEEAREVQALRRASRHRRRTCATCRCRRWATRRSTAA